MREAHSIEVSAADREEMGGGGSQQPAETWGGECRSFWSQRKQRNGGDRRRCGAQIRCTEPSDIPLAHRHCPPGQVPCLAWVAHSASVRRPGPTHFWWRRPRAWLSGFLAQQASHAFAHEPRFPSHTRSFETPAPRMRAQPQAQPIRLGRRSRLHHRNDQSAASSDGVRPLARTDQGMEPSDCVRLLEIAAAPARVLEGVDRERTVLILVRLVPAQLNKDQRQ